MNSSGSKTVGDAPRRSLHQPVFYEMQCRRGWYNFRGASTEIAGVRSRPGYIFSNFTGKSMLSHVNDLYTSK
jgi:hypothetical protein